MEKARRKGRSTLRTHSDFQRVYAYGFRLYRNGLVFCVRKARNMEFRYGVSIPGKWGKAVERNLLRRRIREIIRKSPLFPPDAEIIFCIKRPCQKFSFQILEEACEWAFARIHRVGFESEPANTTAREITKEQ